jgi:cytochrome c biogenesis protein CcmG/thiol:disulfide interchange protein DsbE
MNNTASAIQRKGSVPVWIQVLIWILLIGLLMILGISLSRSQQGSVKPGDPIKDFSLTTFAGYEYNGNSKLQLSDLRGKVVLINFWASWCKTCEQEATELNAAWVKYRQRGDVVFLGVDWSDTPAPALAYLQKFGIIYPNGPDLGTRISQQFRITGVPETYFIDRQGVLRYVQVGPFTSADQIQSNIDRLIE